MELLKFGYPLQLRVLLSAGTAQVWVSITVKSIASGFDRGLPFYQFFNAARFSAQTFSVSLSNHGGCFLPFREPFVLCVLFQFGQFQLKVLTRPFIPERIMLLDDLLLSY